MQHLLCNPGTSPGGGSLPYLIITWGTIFTGGPWGTCRDGVEFTVNKHTIHNRHNNLNIMQRHATEKPNNDLGCRDVLVEVRSKKAAHLQACVGATTIESFLFVGL